MKAIADYGPIYSSAGIEYVKLSPDHPTENMKGTGLGVRTNTCEPFEGVVDKFYASSNSAWWWILILEDQRQFEVNHNWVAQNDSLKPGDEVEGLINKLNGGLQFWKIQRKVKEVESA